MKDPIGMIRRALDMAIEDLRNHDSEYEYVTRSTTWGSLGAGKLALKQLEGDPSERLLTDDEVDDLADGYYSALDLAEAYKKLRDRFTGATQGVKAVPLGGHACHDETCEAHGNHGCHFDGCTR